MLFNVHVSRYRQMEVELQGKVKTFIYITSLLLILMYILI